MAGVEQQVTALEMERVIPKIRTLFEREGPFYTWITKNSNVEVVSMRSTRVPLEMRPGGAFQYFDPNGGDLGRGGMPSFDKATVAPVFMSENIEYTKLVQWATDKDRKSIANAVKRLTASALDELQRQIDSQLMGDGRGVIGTIGVVATASGVDTYTLNVDGFGSRLVRYGQTVQVYDPTLNTLRGKGIITNHDVANNQIDVTPAVAGALVNDLLVVDGITAPNSLPALFGVAYHHSNSSVGSWLGFSRATTPEIRANRVNGNASPIALPLPRLAMAQIGNRAGSNNVPSVTPWLHPAQIQAYEDIGQALMMIDKGGSKNDTLDLYFNKVLIAGMTPKTHFSWDKRRVDFIPKGVWNRAEILPIGYYKTDGRQIFEIRASSGGVAASDIFYMVNGFQTFLSNPSLVSYIDNLAVPAGY